MSESDVERAAECAYRNCRDDAQWPTCVTEFLKQFGKLGYSERVRAMVVWSLTIEREYKAETEHDSAP